MSDFKLLELLYATETKPTSFTEAFELLENLIREAKLQVDLPSLESNLWHVQKFPFNGYQVHNKNTSVGKYVFSLSEKGGVSIQLLNPSTFASIPGIDGHQTWGEGKSYHMENFSEHPKFLVKKEQPNAA